ncbi:Zinc finger, CCHC-type [Cucumis melo var. makuwa]|uniref:Zinc finger, CCHC-type n=1 Tax=Cucumis melo var. makuwa TaxID=1194695 RepID=A0A5D3CSF6_CUCMM|nr:Zinc finger, CCHC-type [Cucumis melo var. makuwa]TYK14332.1 Zinc finger, CCHC-type [Cucumis melo var. makuwa]
MNLFVLLYYIVTPCLLLTLLFRISYLRKKVSTLPSDAALATTYLRQTNETSFCKNCKLHGHKFANYPTIECRYCHKRGHILNHCPTRPPRPSGHSHKPNFSYKVGSPSVVAATVGVDALNLVVL